MGDDTDLELFAGMMSGQDEQRLGLELAYDHPELFEVRDGQVLVRPEAEGEPCPCCGMPLAASPLPRTEEAT